MPILPEREKLLCVIGGHKISSEAGEMAELLGYAIIEAGYKLATGGRRGAGEHVSRGAVAYCHKHGLDVYRYIFAILPWGDDPDFSECCTVHAGKNKFERGMVLMNRTKTAFIIGGGVGTEHEIMHAAVDDYMGYETTANIMPVSGTGGVAEHVLSRSRRYDDHLLDSSTVTAEKAIKLVESINNYRFELFNFWNVNIHDGWLSGDQHPVVRRTHKIRNYYDTHQIKIEGE